MPTAAPTEMPKAAPSFNGPGSPASADVEILAFPASVAQQVFWYLEMFQSGVTAFNIPMRFRLDGALDVELLRRSLAVIADRHESMRTHFEEENGELQQVVSPTVDFDLPVHDLSALPTERKSVEADRLATEEARKPFSLNQGPLWRAELVRLGREEHVFHVTAHHAIFDGSSMTVFTEELAAIYRALHEGNEPNLEPLPIQYGDFSVWQKEFLEGPEVKKQIEFWKKRLAGMREIEVPSDRPRPPVKNWQGDLISLLLPKILTDQLQAIAARNGATLFQLLLTAFKFQLARYTGQEDIAVGTPITGRMRAELEPLIGVFINSLILRTDLSGNPTFEEALGRVRDTAFAAVENQDVPFECLVKELRPARDAGRNPLFQVNFTHQRSFAKAGTFGGVSLTPIPSRSPGAIFDLHFFMVERAEGWRVTCDFATDLFDRSTAERMLGHFRHLLEQVAANPVLPLARFHLPCGEELDLVARKWAGKPVCLPEDSSIGRTFLEVAKTHAERPALVSGDRRWTYAELRDRALALAASLHAAGLKPGEPVAFISRPSPEQIIGVLGIVLAGGAYMPVDPEYPAARALGLIKSVDCLLAVAVDLADCAAWSEEWSGTILTLPDADSAAKIESKAGPDDAAYILFTSGSTGQPKGVVVPHRAVLRLVCGCDWIDLKPGDVFLQTAPLSFDASTFEIWGPLLNGGTLVLPEGGLSLPGIAAAAREQKVNHLWLTSGLFQLMIEEHADDLAGVQNLITGGEAMSLAHARLCREKLPGTRLLNGYGPTENTTFTCVHEVTDADLAAGVLPIGKPISGTTTRIVDIRGQLAPIGIPGELLCGGDGLALEYAGDENLTREKFPLLELEDGSTARFYRTGDRCCWRADGTILYLGREDEQIKVRGYRIEPGEVETVLASHPSVKRCKVAARGTTSAGKRLLAWVVIGDGAGLDIAALREHLAARLPVFMRPEAIIQVPGFSITANGKIDVKALPDPADEEKSGGRADASPPSGETETKLAAIWSDLLGCGDIHREDDFFALGGHSLLALRLFARINREFGRTLPLASLIHHPTLAGLAVAIENGGSAGKKEAELEQGDEDSVGHLVTLKPGVPGEVPLFCIHGGDGAVLFYRGFAALLPETLPVHAIESLALSNRSEVRQRSIEETAAAYARLIEGVWPHGPVRVAGYSFGGVVAHAIACHFAERGREVDFLGLFDTHNPSAPRRRYSAAERLTVFWKQNRERGLPGRLLALGGRIGEGVATHRRVKAEVEQALRDGPAEEHSDLRRVQVREENRRAMDAYHPPVFPGAIILFKAMTPSDKVEWPEDFGWSSRAGGGLRIVPVPGRHLTLFERGHVETLARSLLTQLPT